MHSRCHTVSLLIAASALSACQTAPVIRSEPVSATTPGLVYALPKAQVLVEASRKVITGEDVDKARKAAAQAADAVKEATAAQATAKAALSDAEAVLAAANAATRAELTQKRDVADAVARVRSAQVEAAKQAAKEAATRLADLEGKEGSYEMSASLKQLSAVPDPARRYAATLDAGGTRDDSIKLATVNGMLSNSSTESTGQVAAILVNIASAISGARMPSATWSLRSVNPPRAPEKTGTQACQAFATSIVFDPTDSDAKHAAIDRLREASQGSLALAVTLPAVDGPQAAPTIASTGLVYRAPTPVNIEVASQSSAACPIVGTPSSTTLNATVPDSRASYVLPVTASSFTKTKTAFEFKDGMPTSLHVDQPSQLAAITRIPIDIMKAILEVPGSLIKLRVDYDSQAVALTDAEVKQLKSQLDLLKAKAALKDAQAVDPD
jgi:hypothetical protein